MPGRRSAIKGGSQRFLIPLLRRTRGWQLAHYELLTYEPAASQDLGPSRPGEGLGLGSLLP
jgi:hypothetical protein